MLPKTEALWCTHPRRQQQLPKEPLCIGCDTLQPVRHVHNLGTYIDNGLTVNTHVWKTVASCLAALRQICSIQHSVSRPVLLSLVTSLVLSRLDYGSATLAGISKYQLDRLHVSSAELASTTMCLHCFKNCIGFLFLNASIPTGRTGVLLPA